MKIMPIHSYMNSKTVLKQEKPSNENELTFTGATKLLKNKVFIDGQRDVLARLAKSPKKSLVVGQLPEAIFSKIPVDKRAIAIPAILGAFDLATKAIRDYEGPVLTAQNFFSFTESDKQRPQIANDILTDVLRKYNVIGADEKINLEYFGKGISSKAFLIEGIRDVERDDDFLLKVYYKVQNPDWHAAKTHGVHAELNNAVYWKEQAGQNTQKGKFYCGSLESGYMMTNRLDEDARFPKKEVSPYHFGLDYDRLRPKATHLDVERSQVKGYNYSHSGMPVVNRIKNESKYARNFLAKMEKLDPTGREELWDKTFYEAGLNETKLAALALSIKYIKNKNDFVDLMLGYDFPKVNHALAYLLKYLPKKDALKYFEVLAAKQDPLTQVILFNEIPLLGKRFNKDVEIKDDVHVSLMEILPDKILKYYEIAEKYAVPEAVEHLASSVHMLPITKMVEYYSRLAEKAQTNPALMERMEWKINILPQDFQPIARELLYEQYSK